jgi:hypothetical protein
MQTHKCALPFPAAFFPDQIPEILDENSAIQERQPATKRGHQSGRPIVMDTTQLITVAIAVLYLLHAIAEWRHW